MLSDESSSDSETGRFKCRSSTREQQHSNTKTDNVRDAGRSRHTGGDRFSRFPDRKRDSERNRSSRNSRDRDKGRDRHRYPRHSPIRRRPSRERSPVRLPDRDRNRHKTSRDRSKDRDHRSNSRDHSKHSSSHSRSRSYVSHDNRKEQKDEPQHNSDRDKKNIDKKRSQEKSASPDHKGKRSMVYKPPPAPPAKKKSVSPIVVEEHESDKSEEVQPGSYYSMIPAVVKDKSEESSEIDSSDDERLRAKLLNLEKELHKSKKKKHKKKHKRKGSKSKDREVESTASVEVSSTTDIKTKPELVSSPKEVVEEVSSTQKTAQKESCEEGEISTDDSQIEIEPTDLRHKIRQSQKHKTDVCGPALPPHLEKKFEKSSSPEIEGPALPPHLQKTSKNIGPSIPEDMRKVLAERDPEVVKYDSSDEDTGIGPLPSGAEEKWSDAHRKLEERALDIKIKKLDAHSETKVKSREKWMLELPEGKAKILGLEARSFRAKAGPDMSDRSSWTDTPEDKALKAAGKVKEEDIERSLKDEARMRHISSSDNEQEAAVKKHKKKHKREESLLELHQKKLKKKKKKDDKEDDGKKERRPFSRDVDLQVNRFDEAQKKSIIKKAQNLNSRFSRGEAKFL